MPKKLFWIILVPSVLIIAAYLFLRFSLGATIKEEEKQTGKLESVDSLGGKQTTPADLRPLFIERMQQLVKKSSGGLYDLTVGDMKVDVLASTVALHKVSVKTNEQALQELKTAGQVPANIFDIAFNSLIIEGINLDDAITRKTMDYKLVRLVNPVIHVYRQSKTKNEANGSDFSNQFLKQMSKLEIKHLVVEGATIVSHSSKNKINKLQDVQVSMNQILLDSNTRMDKSRFLFAKNATISFRNFFTATKDGLYHFKIGKGIIKAPEDRVDLQHVSFASPLGRAGFMKQQKVAKEYFDLSLASVSLNKVDWWTLLNEEEFLANTLTASKGKLAVYFDRSLPLKSKMGNFPNQLLMKLPLKMNVSQLRVQNLDLSYTELNPLSAQTGTIYFDNVSLNARHVSNESKNPVVINSTALFMHQVPIRASFTLNMVHAQAGGFTAVISTDKAFESSLLNSFSIPLGMMKTEKGSLQKIQATIRGDQHKASGEVLMLYKDLKMSLMEKDRGKTTLDKKDVTSLLANLFVIKNDNPKDGKEPRKETASFQRDPNGGFFMLIWKTMLVGILKTIGAPEKIAYKKPTAKQ